MEAWMGSGITERGCRRREVGAGLGFQPNGIKVDGSNGPIGFRGTIMPLARRKRVSLLPGERPMLTPISVRPMDLTGRPVFEEVTVRLSIDWRTIATLPNATGGRVGLKPDIISLGVRGADALQMLLLRVSPTD